MIERLARLLGDNCRSDGITQTSLPRVHILRSVTFTEPVPLLHTPAVCFVAQGRKQTALSDETYLYRPMTFLIVSVELPIAGQIVEASPDKPYLCLRLDLDPAAIADVIHAAAPEGLPDDQRDDQPQRGIAVDDVTAPLLDAVVRLADLLESGRESDRAVLAPLAEREILYRLLLGAQGDRLRQIARPDSRLGQITRAISLIKSRYDKALTIEEIAEAVHMSVSSFHQHFKTVTALSPLQYQKQIRLQEARRLMTTQAIGAASAAFSVGYESPSQFSRDYARLFGLPPKRDVEKMKALPAASWQ
jgi:AraC-like DNA-binding protein